MKAVVIASMMMTAVVGSPAAAQQGAGTDETFALSSTMCDAFLSEAAVPDVARETDFFQTAGLELADTSIGPVREQRVYVPKGWAMDGAMIRVLRPASAADGLQCSVIMMGAKNTPDVAALVDAYSRQENWRDEGTVVNIVGSELRVFRRDLPDRKLKLMITGQPMPMALYQIEESH